MKYIVLTTFQYANYTHTVKLMALRQKIYFILTAVSHITWLQVASQEAGSWPNFQDSHQKHLRKKWKLMGTLSSF